MKSPHLYTFARIVVVAAAAGVMTACVAVRDNHAPAPYHSRQTTYYDYWYYPAIGAYYDSRSRVYIYFDRDSWVHARALPHRVMPYRGDYVIIRSPNDRPYEQQYKHRKQYEPERYKRHERGHQGKNIWIGAPRQYRQR